MSFINVQEHSKEAKFYESSYEHKIGSENLHFDVFLYAFGAELKE